MGKEILVGRPRVSEQVDTMRGLLIGLDKGTFRGDSKIAAQEQLTVLAKKILLFAPTNEVAAIEIDFGYDQRGSDPYKRALAQGLRDEFVKAALAIIGGKGLRAVHSVEEQIAKRRG